MKTQLTAQQIEQYRTQGFLLIEHFLDAGELQRWREVTDDAVRQRLAEQREDFPTLADHGHFDDRDEDALFDQGLTYLLDGISARQR